MTTKPKAKAPAKRGRPPVPNSAAGISRALELVRAGRSYAQAAKETGLDRTTVGKAARAAGLASDQAHAKASGRKAPGAGQGVYAPPPPDVPDEPPPPDADEDVTLDSEIRRMSAQLKATRKLAEDAAASGDNQAAFKYNRDASVMSNTLVRIMADARKQAGEGGIVFTEAELKEAHAKVVQLVADLARSPEARLGVCPSCGSRMRIDVASEGTHKHENI